MNILDLTILSCPLTIIKTKQAMDQLSSGQCLLIKGSDPSFIIDCKVYTNKTGNRFISNWSNDDKIYCLLQKK